MAPKTLQASLLDKQVRSYIPELPIKQTATWIAIVPHTVEDYSDIKSSDDILWAKAHGKITLRTLKYQYYARHPLESFKLQFLKEVPDEMTTVNAMKRLYPFRGKGHPLLVLRAVEIDEDAVSENEPEDDQAIHEDDDSGPLSNWTDPGGKDVDNPIVLSDDEEEEAETVSDKMRSILPAAGERDHCQSPRRSRASMTSTKEPKTPFGSTAISEKMAPQIEPVRERVRSETPPWEKTPDIADEQNAMALEGSEYDEAPRGPGPGGKRVISETHPSEQLQITQARSIDGTNGLNQEQALQHVTEGMIGAENGAANPPNAAEAETASMTYPAPLMRLLARVGSLPEAARENVEISLDHHCGNVACRKFLRIKPWTEFSPDHTPLCTECSFRLLRSRGEYDSARWLHAALEKEEEAKEQSEHEGYAQSFDADAPIDAPNFGQPAPGVDYQASLRLTKVENRSLEPSADSFKSVGEHHGPGNMHSGIATQQNDLSEISTGLDEMRNDARVQQRAPTTFSIFEDPQSPLLGIPRQDNFPDLSTSYDTAFNENDYGYSNHGHGSYQTLLQSPINQSLSRFSSASPPPYYYAQTLHPHSLGPQPNVAPSLTTLPTQSFSALNPSQNPGAASTPAAPETMSYSSIYSADANTASAKKRSREAFEADLLDPRGSVSPLAQYSNFRDRSFEPSSAGISNGSRLRIRCVDSGAPRHKFCSGSDESSESSSGSNSIAPNNDGENYAAATVEQDESSDDDYDPMADDPMLEDAKVDDEKDDDFQGGDESSDDESGFGS